MATKALILLIASLLVGLLSLVVLAVAALRVPPTVLEPQLAAFLWVCVGQMAVVLGIFTDRKPQA